MHTKWLWAVAWFALTLSCAQAADRPNVLLICVDDLKPLLGCYGDTNVKSPHIDRLAARGVQFNAAYCNQAVCSPSRNALLTGYRSQTLGIYDLGTNFRAAKPDAVTLPQYFKQHGYHTAAMGKIFHVGHGNQEDAASWSVPHFQPKAGTYQSPANQQAQAAAIAAEPKKKSGVGPKGAAYESAAVADDAYADGKTADEAIRRLQAAREKPSEPFFLAVGFVRPHLPFVAPQKYWDLYDRAQFKLATPQVPPVGAPKMAPQFGGELRNYLDIPAQGTLPEDLQRTLIHGYHAATSYMDAQVGRVLQTLEETGLAKNTIIVLWGDHGWHLGDHGMWCKHTNYEQAARIPLLVVAPGVSATGAKSNSLVESVDIYPMLCELAGLPAPTGPEGRSFVATLRDPAAATKASILHVYPRGKVLGRAVRTAQYRLVEWKVPGAAPETAELELYDYTADPLETKSLAAERPEVVAQLRAILNQQPEAKPQIKAPAADTAAKPNAKPVDRAAMFAKRDANHDGQLTREEFLKGQPDPAEAPARFTRFDVDQNGTLSREEFVTSGKAKP